MSKLIDDLKAAAADWMETDIGLGYGQAILDIIAENVPATFTDCDGDVWTLRENGKYGVDGDPQAEFTVDEIRAQWGERR